MKRRTGIGILVALAAVYLVYITHRHVWGHDARMQRQHLYNITQVQPGMDTATVIHIMGTADYIMRPFKNHKDTKYKYHTVDESDPDIYITFDSGMHVTATFVPATLQ